MPINFGCDFKEFASCIFAPDCINKPAGLFMQSGAKIHDANSLKSQPKFIGIFAEIEQDIMRPVRPIKRLLFRL